MPPLSQRALERRLKRHVLKATHSFFAPCAPGFEEGLEAEIRALPAVTEIIKERGGVAFTGPLDTVYHANLWLRSAQRVLLRIDDFLAQSYPALFDRSTRVPWEHYLGFNERYALSVSAKASRLRHHKNIAETLHSGVLKALEPHGLAPDLDDEAPLKVQARMFRDRCTLSLDTSGEHLHRRGYRTHIGTAPLRETLAASLLLASDWAHYDVIFDPFCGAGTLLTEAALLATGRAPGLMRSFAFEAIPSFSASKWARFKREALAKMHPPTLRLVGSDLEPGVIRAARVNAAEAGLDDITDFAVADARVAVPPRAVRGLVASNLPYGERLGSRTSAQRLAEDFSQRLSEHYRGWDFALISREPGPLVATGLASEVDRRFRNGGLEVYLIRGRVPT